VNLKKIEKFELKNLYDKIVAINNENPGNLLRIIFKGNYASGDGRVITRNYAMFLVAFAIITRLKLALRN
jgi:hypothetical protein